MTTKICPFISTMVNKSGVDEFVEKLCVESDCQVWDSINSRCGALVSDILIHDHNSHSHQKSYDIDYPVSLCPKSVRIFPEIITLSSENPGEVRVEIPHEIHLEKIVLLPLGITIPFQEEVMWSDPYSSTYVVRCGWVNTRLPAGFRFGTLSFQFSNGTEQKKGFLVKGSEEKAARS